MKLLRGFEDPAAYRGGFVSIGNFDGVHRGHQSMIAALVRHARAAGVPAVVFTFDPHPIQILRPDFTPPNLSTTEHKAELLEQCGVDCVIAYPTDAALLNLTSEQFFQRIIREELQARGLVEGSNFFFGHNRAGNIETLRELCDGAGLTLEVVPQVALGGRTVSSSAIRACIAEGKITEAVELLGHPYRIRGRVVGGAVRGRTLGFPTANLHDVTTLLPCDGVYAGIAHHQGRKYPAAIHLGPNATFGEQERKLEIHLVDFHGDLYGEELEVDVSERLRDTRSFGNADELRKQVEQDIERTRRLVSGEW